MEQSQPYFTLHNGQIMLVNAPTTDKEKAMLDDSFYVDEDDDMSLTSSTMSESLADEDDNDNESFYTSDEEELDLDVPLRPNNHKLNGSGRSTVSLDAYFQSAQHLQASSSTITSMPATMSIPQQMAVARTKSMASMALARQMAQKTTSSSTGMLHAWQQKSAQESSSSIPSGSSGPATTALAAKPDGYLAKNILQLATSELQTVSYNALKNYFLPTSPEMIAAWDADLLRAIRTQNLELVKEMHRAGKPLQACNQFGESILHVCIRRGTPEILKYLLEEGGVSPRLCCDYGRTPLHDGCWVLSNNVTSFQMIGLLLERCPEMLLIADKRGFTPLNYVPKDRWAACCEVLDQHASHLQQRLKKKQSTNN